MQVNGFPAFVQQLRTLTARSRPLDLAQLGLFASPDTTPGGAPLFAATANILPFAPPAAERTKLDRTLAAARSIALALQGGRVTNQQISASMTRAFGGTDANGSWSAQDANDAREAALVSWLLRRPVLASPGAELARLEALDRSLQAETRRSTRTERFQQYSTPAPMAYLVALAAAIVPQDRVLEPSAGTGLLAVQAKRFGVTDLLLNELDPDRAAILRALLGPATEHDALNMAAYLGNARLPSVVLMNPPFSAHARADVAKDSTYGVRHILQAARALAPGGRLVSIVGEGQDPERLDSFRAVLDLGKLRANLPLAGEAYRRMGTGFGTRLLALDKGRDLADAPIVRADQELALAEALRLVQTIAPRAGRQAAAIDRRPLVQFAPETPARPAPQAAPTFTAAPLSAGSGRLSLARDPAGQARIEDGAEPVRYEVIEAQSVRDDDELFAEYRPQRIRFQNAQPHGASLVQTQAMAAVAPPIPTYVPCLSPLAQNMLSEAQLEVTVYAGNAHEQFVRIEWDTKDNGRILSTVRRGYYCGDSTGVGKGRITASIIADNYAQGRTRALWVSERSTLIEDATRDWTALGGDKEELIPLIRTPADAELGAKRGILFSTYSLLRSKNKAGRTRLDQIVEWLGEDFDGVLALDEAHNAANALGSQGAGGRKQAGSQQALAVLEIQRRLPQARVVYLSATAATQIEGLAYAERLGLWGAKPAAFDTRDDFLSTISAAGTGGLEIACRDLKAMGVYLSRALSMRGVEYQLAEHKLTDWDRQTYGALNTLWRTIEAQMREAMTLTGVTDAATGKTLDSQTKSRIESQLQATKLRVYAAFLTTIKLPTVLDLAQQRLDAGNSLIFQIANTYEATLDRALANQNEESDTLDDLDLSPKDMIEQFLDSTFPVFEQEIYLDEDDKEKSRPVLDPEGHALLNPEAVAMRAKLIDELANYTIPAAPLDLILEHFGAERCAEITGRSKRVVIKTGPDGRPHKYAEKRVPAVANIAETNAFQEGKKRILVFSNAGSTGRSYHADKNAGNQQKRSHFLLQAGWQATVAMQGLGRSHRTNQAQPPEYVLCTTDVPGEKRLTSTIARRLETLGAMTRGERAAVGGGLFSASDNLETLYAQDALTALVRLIAEGQIKTIPCERFCTQTLLRLDPKTKRIDNLSVPRFLNRVLACDLDLQEEILDAFFCQIEEAVAVARAQNRYDEGVRTLQAISVREVRQEVIFEDPQTRAQAHLVELALTRNEIVNELPKVVQRVKMARRIHGDHAAGFFQDEEHGIHARLRITIDGQTNTRILTPFAEHVSGGYYTGHLDEIPALEGQTLWQERVGREAKILSSSCYLACGNLLPIWTRLPNSAAQIYQVRLEGGRRILGRMVDVSDLGALRKGMGLAETDGLTPAEALATLQQGRAIMAGRYPICRARVNHEPRYEVLGDMLISRRAILESNYGVAFERHGYRWRAFVSTDPAAALDSITKLSESQTLRAVG